MYLSKLICLGKRINRYFKIIESIKYNNNIRKTRIIILNTLIVTLRTKTMDF